MRLLLLRRLFLSMADIGSWFGGSVRMKKKKYIWVSRWPSVWRRIMENTLLNPMSCINHSFFSASHSPSRMNSFFFFVFFFFTTSSCCLCSSPSDDRIHHSQQFFHQSTAVRQAFSQLDDYCNRYFPSSSLSLDLFFLCASRWMKKTKKRING